MEIVCFTCSVLGKSAVHEKKLSVETTNFPREPSFFYSNIATTTCALKYVKIVIDYKILTMYGEGKQRILLGGATVLRKHFIWFLKLSTKHRFFELMAM